MAPMFHQIRGVMRRTWRSTRRLMRSMHVRREREVDYPLWMDERHLLDIAHRFTKLERDLAPGDVTRESITAALPLPRTDLSDAHPLTRVWKRTQEAMAAVLLVMRSSSAEQLTARVEGLASSADAGEFSFYIHTLAFLGAPRESLRWHVPKIRKALESCPVRNRACEVLKDTAHVVARMYHEKRFDTSKLPNPFIRMLFVHLLRPARGEGYPVDANGEAAAEALTSKLLLNELRSLTKLSRRDLRFENIFIFENFERMWPLLQVISGRAPRLVFESDLDPENYDIPMCALARRFFAGRFSSGELSAARCAPSHQSAEDSALCPSCRMSRGESFHQAFDLFPAGPSLSNPLPGSALLETLRSHLDFSIADMRDESDTNESDPIVWWSPNINKYAMTSPYDALTMTALLLMTFSW